MASTIRQEPVPSNPVTEFQRTSASMPQAQSHIVSTTPQPVNEKEIAQVSTDVVAWKHSRSDPSTDERAATKVGATTLASDAMVWSVPIQIWEGKVQRVDEEAKSMEVTLMAKVGTVPEHTGEIELEWVAPQDLDLVRPGAIFYWTIYKETRRGSVRNYQELRFRRFPTWSRTQIARLRAEAERLHGRVSDSNRKKSG